MEAKNSGREAAIALYSGLARAALSSGEWPLLILWAVAHQLAAVGHPGWATRREIADAAKGVYGLSYIRELLRDSRASRWFRPGKDIVGLVGASTAGTSFYLSSLGSRQLVPLSRLQEGRAGRRGAVLSAWLPERHPVSQRTIRVETSVAPRTVSKYSALGCFEALRQDAEYDLGVSREQRKAIARENSGIGVYCWAGGLRKRLPNIYKPSAPRLRRGARSKALDRELRAKANVQFQPLFSQKRSKPRVRVYFDRPADWVKCNRLRLGMGKSNLVWPRALDFAYVSRRGAHSLWTALRVPETA